MDIGTGIAIAGAWVFAGMMGVSPTVSSLGMWIAMALAIAATVFLALV